MNPALTSLVWHVLSTPRSPDDLIAVVKHLAPCVGKDAIENCVCELWAVRLIGFQDGLYKREQRHVLHLSPSYRKCRCGRQLAIEIRVCRKCERENA